MKTSIKVFDGEDLAEYLELSRKLEHHHELFYQFWNLGEPIFTEDLPTAAVGFDPLTKDITYYFNPHFYEKLTPYGRAFVICHECLHVILNHFTDRMNKREYQSISNVAMDVVVNELLINSFGFDDKLIEEGVKEAVSNMYEMEAERAEEAAEAFKKQIEENLPEGGKLSEEDKKAIGEMFGKKTEKEEELAKKERFGCWLDTVFKDKEKYGEVEPNREFEYYFNKIVENNEMQEVPGQGGGGGGQGEGQGEGDGEGGENGQKQGEGGGAQKIPKDALPGEGDFDSHQYSDMPEEAVEEIAEQLGEKLSNQAKEGLKQTIKKVGGQQAGNAAGNLLRIVKVKVKTKRKWETVIKEWAVKSLQTDSDNEQWARTNRRIASLNTDFMLPSVMEEESHEKDKLEVWFFQDTSGSCYGFQDRFFSAAKSLPKDKFDVKMFCFDTKVYETTLESGKLYGFGGTYFSILEDAIQAAMKKDKVPYPKAVFVITDGYGNNVNPQIPQRWHWFLSTEAKDCIHPKCHIHSLSNFE